MGQAWAKMKSDQHGGYVNQTKEALFEAGVAETHAFLQYVKGGAKGT